jgi:hypothetical protein
VSEERESHLEDILRNALKHIMPVTQPPALIFQVSHSGGSLLNRLFDGHPEINALPHEFATRPGTKHPWPAIDLAKAPQDWFKVLFTEADIASIRKKFRHVKAESTTVPFVFLQFIQEQIFLKQLDSSETIKRRDVIDAYITSCFGAWLDYQNLSGPKKYTTVCAVDLSLPQESMENFFKIYPAGKLISLVRNPEDWLAWARTQEPEIYENTQSATNRWQAIVRAVLEIKRKYGDRVCLIKFEDLINNSGSIMRYLAEFLEISFEDILLTPTFNSISLQPPPDQKTNKTDAKFGYFIDAKALEEDHRTLVKKTTMEDYQAILREVVVN